MFSANIIESRQETPKLCFIQLQAPKDFVYHIGQYVRVSTEVDSNAGYFFALCSHPQQDFLAFLIDTSNTNNQNLLKADNWYISEAMGNGFPVKKIEYKHVICITHGSGISAIYPFLLEFQQNQQKYHSLHTFYGLKNAEHLPFAETFTQLQSQKLSNAFFHPIYSDKNDSPLKKPNSFYVQNALDYHFPKNINIQDTVVLIVGSNSMVKETKNILSKKELLDENILLNY